MCFRFSTKFWQFQKILTVTRTWTPITDLHYIQQSCGFLNLVIKSHERLYQAMWLHCVVYTVPFTNAVVTNRLVFCYLLVRFADNVSHLVGSMLYIIIFFSEAYDISLSLAMNDNLYLFARVNRYVMLFTPMNQIFLNVYINDSPSTKASFIKAFLFSLQSEICG